MKILTIFIDMIRPNRLSTFNPELKADTPLDTAFKELGGTAYRNCFTPGPDTPRGISTFSTGIDPYKNGCNTRLKWPGPFLNKELKTVYDLFLDKDYKLDLYSSLNERAIGFFPDHISKMNIFNKDHDLDGYLNSLTLEDKHYVFIGIADYHWMFDDLGYTKQGERESYKITKDIYDLIFKRFNKDEFDHIFIFSDHGFKFNYELKKYPKEFLLNDDRTNVIMQHRKKYQNKLVKNDKLCSLADLYATYQDVLKSNVTNGISLLSKKERDYVISEDHINFTPSVNQNIELWSLTNKNHIYIRTLEKAILINRTTKEIDKGIIEEYDEILKENSAFGIYFNEYEKVFKYVDNIKYKLNDNSYYSNNILRTKKNNLSVKILSTIELLFNNKHKIT